MTSGSVFFRAPTELVRAHFDKLCFLGISALEALEMPSHETATHVRSVFFCLLAVASFADKSTLQE